MRRLERESSSSMAEAKTWAYWPIRIPNTPSHTQARLGKNPEKITELRLVSSFDLDASECAGHVRPVPWRGNAHRNLRRETPGSIPPMAAWHRRTPVGPGFLPKLGKVCGLGSYHRIPAKAL